MDTLIRIMEDEILDFELIVVDLALLETEIA